MDWATLLEPTEENSATSPEEAALMRVLEKVGD